MARRARKTSWERCDMGGPGPGRVLEDDAHTAVGALFDGVLGERRTKKILAEAFELGLVAPIPKPATVMGFCGVDSGSEPSWMRR